MFTDRTAGFRQLASSAADPQHSREFRELHSAKAALVAEGESILATAGPGGALAASKLERVEAISAELAAVNERLAQVEAARDQIRRRALHGSAGPGLELPSDALRLPIGRIGLSHPPRSAAQLFGAGSMDGWRDPAEFLQAVRFGMSDSRFQLMAAGSMTEGVPSEGGLLVPVEYSNTLLDASIENEIVRPRAQVEPMNSATKVVAGFDTLDHSGGSIGGFVGQWLAEVQAGTDQVGKTRAIELNAKKLAVFTKASNELGDDSAGFEAALSRILSAGLGWSMDDAFLNGDGTGKPLGVLHDPALIVQNKEGSQPSATISTNNVLAMWSRPHPGCVANAVWVTSSTCLPDLMKLTLGTGTAVTLVYQGDPSGRTFGSLLGRPVLVSEKMPLLGVQGDLLLADFSQYVVGLRKEILLQKSQHVGWQTDESGYRIIARVDGQGKWSGPMWPKSGSSLSWAVTLQAR